MIILSWLPLILSAYLFFSFSALGDKLVLAQKVDASRYTFFIGLSSILAVFLFPVVGFSLPGFTTLIWIILEVMAYMLAVYTMFLALEKFDVSRVAPAVGAFQPIFILLLTLAVWGAAAVAGLNFLAFALLLLGSIIISWEKKFSVTAPYLLLVAFSSLMFSLDYIFSKQLFSRLPVLEALVWASLFRFVVAAVFLASRRFRRHVFLRQGVPAKTGLLFMGAQISGVIAYVFQSFAISLAPVAQLAVINSLRGAQYVFLFIITLLLSRLAPGLLKENFSYRALAQKGISIALIVAGLALLGVSW